MTNSTRPRVLFDEAHGEAWTIRPEAALAMQPAHPLDASYELAAQALRDRDFVVEANVESSLTAGVLNESDILVIAHPSDPTWERTTAGSPRLAEAEITAIEAFVHQGGGLIVLGETEHEKYGNNLNELLGRFSIRLENETVQDYDHCVTAPTWILAELLARVGSACFYRTTTISANHGARVIARAHATASLPGAALLVASEHGKGRVVVLGDSDLFGDDCIDQLDHRALWLNLVYWATPSADRGPRRTPRRRAARIRRGPSCAITQTSSGCSRSPTAPCRATPARRAGTSMRSRQR
jgi:hypothetical protein